MRSRLALGALLAAALALPARPAHAQPGAAPPPPDALVRVSAAPVTIAAGGTAEAAIVLKIAPGWHINANPSSPEYMIPTDLDILEAGGIADGPARHPAPHVVRLGFEESQILVYDGETVVRIPLSAAAGTAPGAHRLQGTVRFQACNDQLCLAPVQRPFALTVNVTGGVSGSAAPAPDTTTAAGGVAPPADGGPGGTPPAPGAGFTTAPPPPGARAAAPENPIARQLASGSWTAFLTLFLIGLALNLTPCVYPMIGVTVSIFGARRAAPPLQVAGLALVYVLGMALMYSALGLIAAFTGGLFGGLLQSPLVLGGIGLLLVALSLSMFGLYEIQLPPALLARLGGSGTTSALGVFASGLVVGIFAAPCIGPPVVALLAVVGAKGDPWFGFWSFFVLAMGLGAPYLVLGTFSNLLQTLPRSGEWMVWVKKVFGIVLFAVGAFYLLLAAAPKLTEWVAPVALIAGGAYLGFFERSAAGRRGFTRLKRVSGGAAVVAGILLASLAPRPAIRFDAFDQAALDASLGSGALVVLDFTADWCVPCHELERITFSDARVAEALRPFHRFRVDLTRYDSPEAERWRREYEITGVPTVVFLTREGRELRAARVEGFLPPGPFLERVRLAAGGARRASE